MEYKDLRPAAGNGRTGQPPDCADSVGKNRQRQRPNGSILFTEKGAGVPDPPRILIIDDEEAARYGLLRALRNQGYALEEAADGLAGLERIEQSRPHVIISDINMPGMDGLTLLKHVGRKPGGPLIILITAYGSEGIAVEALRAGAYDYLPKPFELDELRAIVRNAVEARRLEEENRRYQAALVQSEKMASLGRLVAGVAHEINTPVGVLQSSADTVLRASHKIEQALDEPSAAACRQSMEALTRAAEQCQAAGSRITGVVEHLIRFAQLDRADFQQASVNQNLESTCLLLSSRWGGTVTIARDFGDLPDVECRPRDLNQLFLALLENAGEAIEHAGRPGAILVRTRCEGGCIKVEVADDGCGIAPERLDSLFEPAFITREGRVTVALGLAICYQVVQAHHGSIEMESNPGAGSRFTVTLPLRQPG